MKPIVVLTVGHFRQTPGKRADIIYKGKEIVVREYILNRYIGKHLADFLKQASIEFVFDTDDFDYEKSQFDLFYEGTDDAALEFSRRKAKIRELAKTRDVINVQIHFNAANKRAKGVEVFYHRNRLDTIPLAQCIYDQFIQDFPDRFRRGVKKDAPPHVNLRFGFGMLRNMPKNVYAVLGEFGFFDNQEECNWILNNQVDIAHSIFKSIKTYLDEHDSYLP